MNITSSCFSISAVIISLALTSATCAVAASATNSPAPLRVGTEHWELALLLSEGGRLYQLGCGAAGHEFAPPKRGPARETEFYPAYGDGYILLPALQVTHADGNTSADLQYVKHSTASLDTNVSLTRIEMKDPAYPFFVTLCFKSYRHEDVLEQWAEIRHQEPGPVVLYRFASSAPLFNAKEYWLTQLQGDWAHEANLAEEKLGYGVKVLDSKIGVRASQFRTPSFVLSLDGPAKEDSGEVLGGSLAWSGSFELAFDLDWKNRLRAVCGINPFGSQYHLKPGQTFTTPAMLWTWSDLGKGQVSRNFHRWARRYGIRDGDRPRPVVLNNWEATGFKFDEKTLVSLFDGAKELGVDTFLLDDGWFGNRHPRNDDKAGLGDWQVNTNKLPQGLGYLASEANKRGVQFGIWIEPEMVNPVSDLFEQHPDWVIRQPHRELELSRNQLDLDLSRPAVQEFAWQVINQTVGTPGVGYVKWDANRYITQPGSPYLPPGEQSDLFVDYNFALYDLMARMAKAFPQTTAMLCSGGGGRADYGALRYFHLFWASDNTDPRSRVFIQWGFSHFFPAGTLAAHVTHMGKRPIKFTLDVAMSAALGLDLDVRKLPPAEKSTIVAAVALYKQQVRDVVEQGDLYRLESPYERPRAALDFVSPDRSKAVLFVYQLQDSNSEPLKLGGLAPQMHYRVQTLNQGDATAPRLACEGQTLTGTTLMRDGLVPPCSKAFDSAVISLAVESETGSGKSAGGGL
jgi:alpha-galactosidase